MANEAYKNYYFIVFETSGYVKYEEGRQPLYLNDLIVKLDINKLEETKKIRDKTMEYKKRGEKIYLAISTKGNILDNLIEQYNKNNNKTVINKPSNVHLESVKSASKNIINKSFALFSNKIKLVDLEKQMYDHLIKRNVDPKYSKILTEDVIEQFNNENIEWVKEDDFKTKAKTAVGKILPSVDHNLLLDQIKETNKSGRPFSFCFIGVNGVGKSTSLAKMTKWLLDHNLSVFIAACDTFRAGAVEQLKVHVDRFVDAGQKVGFYESGYNRDDAIVAKSAISNAKSGGYDVVLIDTAGRMHGNKVLMSSLSKIIRVNVPDHIIYVGEALTGNDSCNFINQFNISVNEGNENKTIDSIILTKIDTVGEKIGQIFNLTFSISSPVLFLGCGQLNCDLLEVNAKEIAELLLN